MGQYDLFRKIAQSNLTSKEREVNQIKNDIIRDFYSSPSYESVLIDDISRNVQIVTVTNNTTKENFKKMLSLPNEVFTVGQIVTWNSNKFIVTDIDENQQIQTKGTIQLCNNTLKYYKTNVLYNVPCVITDKLSMSTDDNKYFSTMADEMYILVSNNTTTQLIEIDDIFKIGKFNWQVKNINDVVMQGLLKIRVQITTEEPVAIPDSPTPSQDIVINGADSIIKGYSSEYTVTYDSNVIFSIEGDLATIISQSNNSCTIKAGMCLGAIKLWAKNSDNTVTGYKDINIEGYF